MTITIHEFDYSQGRVLLPPFLNVALSSEESSKEQTTFASDDLNFTGMARVAKTISDVIVGRLTKMGHVKAILMGRSGDVYRVWTMIDDWSAPGRKAIYGAQKELLVMLCGIELDFYVVPIEECSEPGSMVSDIPMVFPIAS